MKGSLYFFLIILLSLLTISCSKTDYFIGDFTVLAENLDFPEGLAIHQDQLVFSNCYGGWIASVENGFCDTLLNREQGLKNTNGTAFDAAGNLYICEYGKGQILKYSIDKKLEILTDKDHQGNKFNRPNDIALSPSGLIYFTDPKSYDENIFDGRVFQTDPISGETKCIMDGLQFPNGLSFSPDGKILYVGESVNKNILSIHQKNGTIDTLITLPPGNQDPDGMDVDEKGNLYIAYFGGGKIFVVSPEGELLDSLKTPGSRPSNVEFGGKDMRTLYISECETNKVYAIRTGIAGHVKK
ncbi:MAG: SMP-30/gluconolactonase/LRE family protein [Candidatus Neomarinimicrobiota bacterium]